jgi:hypothetical protein
MFWGYINDGKPSSVEQFCRGEDGAATLKPEICLLQDTDICRCSVEHFDDPFGVPLTITSDGFADIIARECERIIRHS